MISSIEASNGSLQSIRSISFFQNSSILGTGEPEDELRKRNVGLGYSAADAEAEIKRALARRN
jgi:hypothetical protein